MIEQGIVGLVNGTAAVTDLAAVGGFNTQLPENQPLPSWSYKFFGGLTVTGNVTVGGFQMRRLEIDCYAKDDAAGHSGAALAIQLAAAIDAVLHGYQGTLPDPDATRVNSILRAEEPMDFFDDAARSSRRVLEYEVWFYQ